MFIIIYYGKERSSYTNTSSKISEWTCSVSRKVASCLLSPKATMVIGGLELTL